MIHRRKTWTSVDDSEATKNKNNWRICKKKDYTFKRIDYLSSNTILNDYLMFRIVINLMTEIERMKKYSINFKIKDYSNKEHAKVEKTTKRRNSKTKLYHYIVICQTFQLHDEKKERKEFRKNLFDVFTIKTNEVWRWRHCYQKSNSDANR
jgi:hypothetical protein